MLAAAADIKDPALKEELTRLFSALGVEVNFGRVPRGDEVMTRASLYGRLAPFQGAIWGQDFASEDAARLTAFRYAASITGQTLTDRCSLDRAAAWGEPSRARFGVVVLDLSCSDMNQLMNLAYLLFGYSAEVSLTDLSLRFAGLGFMADKFTPLRHDVRLSLDRNGLGLVGAKRPDLVLPESAHFSDPGRMAVIGEYPQTDEALRNMVFSVCRMAGLDIQAGLLKLPADIIGGTQMLLELLQLQGA